MGRLLQQNLGREQRGEVKVPGTARSAKVVTHTYFPSMIRYIMTPRHPQTSRPLAEVLLARWYFRSYERELSALS